MSIESDVPAHLYNSLKERSQNGDKQGAIERYYELLSSGHSVGGTLNTAGLVRSESEHGDTATAAPPKVEEVATDVNPKTTMVATELEKAGYTRGLSGSLSHETESFGTEERQAAESASPNKRGSDDPQQLLHESSPGSEPDIVRSADAQTYTNTSCEEAIRSGDHKRLRFGKVPRIRKRIAFGALYTVIGVSVSIAGFSFVRGDRDAAPKDARVQSNISSRTEVSAIPDLAAGRLATVVEAQQPQKQVANADSSQMPKPSRTAESDSAVPGILQRLAVGARETGSAAQQEVEAPQRSDAGHVNAIQQSTAPATAPLDPGHEPTPSVAQSLSATPKGSAAMASHSDTGQPAKATPKDEAKAITAVPTTNVLATSPSRAHTTKRRKASTSRRDAGSKRYVRQQTPEKYR